MSLENPKYSVPLPPSDEMVSTDSTDENGNPLPNKKTILGSNGEIIGVYDKIDPIGNPYKTYKSTGENIRDLLNPTDYPDDHDPQPASGATWDVSNEDRAGGLYEEIPNQIAERVEGLGRVPVSVLSGKPYEGTDESPPPPTGPRAVIDIVPPKAA